MTFLPSYNKDMDYSWLSENISKKSNFQFPLEIIYTSLTKFRVWSTGAAFIEKLDIISPNDIYQNIMTF